ncbi:DDE-type integrase/transposase/recombinase [Luteolibacter ambystomatis]|uniref:DDE-type integrase/transposase/recombinase n=1 Tax=Luteolibacter ambystomatis TaxID=2824561 RepID=A0A975G980_9BACT|nr:DDE-type integrase/transposase/recombinase [Luteolibacter ambystomatis]QUE51143.1 DDE-type integrase/transposase/recombinase [Luteolibacter ambystomatis]
MANHLPFKKKVLAVSMLCEGSSIRGVERITGVHRDTVLRLGLRVGIGCKAILDEKMRGLDLRNIQVDEMWGFVKAKKKTVKEKGLGPDAGDAWLWVALDADTKVVPCFLVGKRDRIHANLFMRDLASRLTPRPQISSDALIAYRDAVRLAFGKEADYGTIVKTFPQGKLRASRNGTEPGEMRIDKAVIQGEPDPAKISTSFVEKQNHTVRMHCRRLARLTNAYSKRRENLDAAVALHYAYYNFCKTHSTIRCAPAMEAGITDTHWSVADLLEMTGEK